MKKRWKRSEAAESAEDSEDAPRDPQALVRTAVGLLARRDHSRAELLQKLTARGFDITAVEALLDRLAAQRLQSDARFAEIYVRMRSGRLHPTTGQLISAKYWYRAAFDATVPGPGSNPLPIPASFMKAIRLLTLSRSPGHPYILNTRPV